MIDEDPVSCTRIKDDKCMLQHAAAVQISPAGRWDHVIILQSFLACRKSYLRIKPKVLARDRGPPSSAEINRKIVPPLYHDASLSVDGIPPTPHTQWALGLSALCTSCEPIPLHDGASGLQTSVEAAPRTFIRRTRGPIASHPWS